MSGEVVTNAWLAEFYRLRKKVYIDYQAKEEIKRRCGEWSPESYNPINIYDEIFGHETKEKYDLDDLDFGAEESKEVRPAKKIESEFDRVHKERRPRKFNYHNRGPRFQSVHLCGSFTNWEKQHPMQFDHITNQWFTMLHLPRGEYFYKYVVNGNDWRVNEEETTKKDPQGNLNNFAKF